MSNWRTLLIGVPEYLSDAIEPLPFIHSDILKLEEAFESSGYLVRSVGLKENPTGGLIRQQIYKFCVKEAKAKDTLVLCFSGHGLHYNGFDYLVPYDAYIEDINNITSYLVPVDFTELFENSAAETIIFFVDACREGIELGSKGVLNIVNWGKGKLNAAKKRDIAIVFSCEPGEVSRYVAKPDGYSLFSRALAEVIHADCQAATFEDVIAELQCKLDEFAKKNEKPQQKVRVHLETSAGNNRLQKRVICKGLEKWDAKPIAENPWYQSAVLNEMWKADPIDNNPSTEDLKFHVGQLIVACHKQWLAAIDALPNDAWRDEGYPTRVLDLTTFLVSKCKPSLELSPAETALLSVAPYIREAVLAAAVGHAANASPFSLKGTGITTGFRAALEKTHLAMPQLVRKAQKLEENKKAVEHDAIATWLMYRCILRIPYVWADKSREGYISDHLLEALLLPSKSQSKATRDSLTKNRLLEMARCINTNPERIERSDRPGAFKPEVYIAPSSQYEQVIREKLLAYLLTLSSWMAIDVRTLHEVIVDHIGLSDPITPEDVLHTVANASWVPDAGGKSLRAICRHPAVDLALHEHVQQVNVILEAIRKKIHTKQDGMDVLEDLPFRLTTHEIGPESTEKDMPLYETPHLRFQLAHNEVRELLMGEQLYGDPSLAIRELYQNALDACRYRQARTTYLERIGKYEGSKWDGHIVFRQGIENGRHYIECEDNGIGMGRRELADAFSCAGRRFSDMPEFIEEQAEWLSCDPPIRLHPNSQFGIGVFSYFMLADEMLVETCRLNRAGKPGQRLLVQISGSGSLFRIRPLNKQGDAGTRVRLYLNKTLYKGRQSGEEKISCLSVMEKLLWVSEFKTEVIEGNKIDVWIPGKLHKQLSEGESVLTPDLPGLWWIKSETNGYSSYTLDDSWFGDGNLLADGLFTETSLICAIVDLNQVHRPKLTIDRKKALDWDRRYVKELLRERVSVLIDNPNWLSYEWILMLETLDPKAADLTIRGLLREKDSILLRLKENQDVLLPIEKIGCFCPDKILLDAASLKIPDNLYIEEINERTPDDRYFRERYNFEERYRFEEEKRKFIGEIRRSIPPKLLRNRINILTEFGWKLPDWLNDEINAEIKGLEDVDSSINSLILNAGDSIALSKDLDGKDPWIDGEVSAIQILICAYKLGESLDETIQRLKRLSSIGFTIPDIDVSQLKDILIDGQDLILLSKKFNGKGPWLEDIASSVHVLQAAGELSESAGNILRRLQRFTPFGLVIPDLNPDQFDDFMVTEVDQILLSKDLDGHGAGLEIEISYIHVLRAAERLNEPVGAVLRRFQRFTPFGLAIPDLNPDQFDDFIVTKDDLILLSRDLDGCNPWLKEGIRKDHVKKASKLLC